MTKKQRETARLELEVELRTLQNERSDRDKRVNEAREALVLAQTRYDEAVTEREARLERISALSEQKHTMDLAEEVEEEVAALPEQGKEPEAAQAEPAADEG